MPIIPIHYLCCRKYCKICQGKYCKSVCYDKMADVMTLADFWQKKRKGTAINGSLKWYGYIVRSVQ